MLTPGGHRRYRLAAVREIIYMAESELGPENVERQTLEQDELVGHAVRPASDVYCFQLLPLQSLVVDQPTTEGLVREMSHVELHYSSTRIADAKGTSGFPNRGRRARTRTTPVWGLPTLSGLRPHDLPSDRARPPVRQPSASPNPEGNFHGLQLGAASSRNVHHR
jgi:hypothetical protein